MEEFLVEFYECLLLVIVIDVEVEIWRKPFSRIYYQIKFKLKQHHSMI